MNEISVQLCFNHDPRNYFASSSLDVWLLIVPKWHGVLPRCSCKCPNYQMGHFIVNTVNSIKRWCLPLFLLIFLMRLYNLHSYRLQVRVNAIYQALCIFVVHSFVVFISIIIWRDADLMFIVCYKRALLISDGVNETTRVPRIVPYACAECAEFWVSDSLWAYLRAMWTVEAASLRCIVHASEWGAAGRGSRAPHATPLIRTASVVRDARAAVRLTVLRETALSSAYNFAGVKIKPATDGSVSG